MQPLRQKSLLRVILDADIFQRDVLPPCIRLRSRVCMVRPGRAGDERRVVGGDGCLILLFNWPSRNGATETGAVLYSPSSHRLTNVGTRGGRNSVFIAGNYGVVSVN